MEPRCGGHRKIALRPIDARLNLPVGKASPLLEEFSQLFCVEKAFGVGAHQFAVVFGQELSVDVLEDINRRMGDQAERFLATLPKPPAKHEGELLVLTGDGKGVPLVKKDAQQVPVFEEKNERPGNRRMATLACTYTVDRHVRTPEQIVAALMHDDTVQQPAPRPEPCFKRYYGCFAEPGHDGVDAVPSAYGAFAWTVNEAARRWRPGQPVIRLMDGQKSLWDAADVCLEELLAMMQAHDPSQQFVDIADVIHVSQYVWRGAKVLYQHREHQEAFVEDRLLRILQGDVVGVVTGMRRMATQRGLKGEQRKEMTTVGALGIYERREGMLAEDRTQFTCLRLVTAMQQGSLGGGHGCTQIPIALVLQEQIDGSVANAQNFLERTAFEIVQGGAFPNRLVNPVGEPVCQGHEDFTLAYLARRCDDHATASMRVVWLHPPA